MRAAWNSSPGRRVNYRLATRPILAVLLLVMSACGGGSFPPSGPVISAFTAAPATIHVGQGATLSWSVSGATSLNISPKPGAVTGTSVPVSPIVTTKYTLTATGPGGSTNATCFVTVSNSSGSRPVISAFTATPATIDVGQGATLSWSVTGATSLNISPKPGAVTGNNTQVYPTATTTYTLTATGSGGSTNAVTTVTIRDLSRIAASFTPESKTAFMYNPPTIVGNFIYLGTSTKIDMSQPPAAVLAALPENFFYKMDLDLNVVWQVSMGSSMVGGGATLDSAGNIYFVTLDFSVNPDPNSKGFFTDINLVSLAPTGAVRWKNRISAAGETWLHAMINCAIGSDDTIYVADSKLFAFNPDGSLQWQYPTNSTWITANRSAPIIDGSGDIYYVSPEPMSGGVETSAIRAYKFHPGNGTPLWATLLDNNVLLPEGGTTVGGGEQERWMLSTPAFSADDTSLYAAVGNTINKIDTATGAVTWSFMPAGMTGSFKASPAVDGQGNVYVGSKSNIDGTFFAIKADGSGLLWSKLIGADLYPSPLLGDDHRVCFGSEASATGHFHCLDMSTGASAWDTGGTGGKDNLTDISFSSPALYNGFIYLGAFQYRSGSGGMTPDVLYKMRSDGTNYLTTAAWPRYHGGNGNTGRK